MSRIICIFAVLCALLPGAGRLNAAEATEETALTKRIAEIGAGGRFTFALVTDSTAPADEAAVDSMKKTVTDFLGSREGKGELLPIDRASPEAAPIIRRFGLTNAPLPLLMVFAPNGAVTGGYPRRVSETQLAGALVSRATMEMMKGLQSGKLVFVCVRGSATADNDAADAGVKEFTESSGIPADVVLLDPADAQEKGLLAQLRLEPAAEKAVTFVLAPPGGMVGRFEGALEAAQITATLQQAMRSSCSDPSCSDTSCPPPALPKPAAQGQTPAQ